MVLLLFNSNITGTNNICIDLFCLLRDNRHCSLVIFLFVSKIFESREWQIHYQYFLWSNNVRRSIDIAFIFTCNHLYFVFPFSRAATLLLHYFVRFLLFSWLIDLFWWGLRDWKCDTSQPANSWQLSLSQLQKRWNRLFIVKVPKEMGTVRILSAKWIYQCKSFSI